MGTARTHLTSQSQLTWSGQLHWLSRAKYASHLLDKVQRVLIKQLEMGKIVLKGVTMKVPAKLHEVLGLRNMMMWGEVAAP